MAIAILIRIGTSTGGATSEEGDMTHGGDLFGHYDPGLVALAFLVAAAASYCALELVAHLNVVRAGARRAWLVVGATIFGLGVWTMHFIGMLAFELPMPIAYHLPTVALSILPAIAAASLALHLASASQLTTARLWGGAVLMGAGIGGMHYGGMFAMRLHANTSYDWRFVLFSVFFAVGASLFALYAAFNLRDDQAHGYERIIGGVIMGGAITGLHFSAMLWASQFSMQMAAPVAPSEGLVATIPPASAVLLAIVALGATGLALGRVRRIARPHGAIEIGIGD